MPDVIPGLNENNIAFIIMIVLAATMLGVPKLYAPFVAMLVGIALTLGHNWSSLDSVERVTEIVIAGAIYGFTAVGAHKTIAQTRDVYDTWNSPGATLSDAEIRAMVARAHDPQVIRSVGGEVGFNRDEGPAA